MTTAVKLLTEALTMAIPGLESQIRWQAAFAMDVAYECVQEAAGQSRWQAVKASAARLRACG